MCGVEVQLVMSSCEVLYVKWDRSMRHGTPVCMHITNTNKLKKHKGIQSCFESSGKSVCTTWPGHVYVLRHHAQTVGGWALLWFVLASVHKGVEGNGQEVVKRWLVFLL